MNRQAFLHVTDANIGAVLGCERSVLCITRSDCGSCRRYERELNEAAGAGRLDGVIVGKLVLDEPGCLRFKKDNPWLRELTHLPFTVLYAGGERVDAFAASKVSYLMERLERAMPARPHAPGLAGS